MPSRGVRHVLRSVLPLLFAAAATAAPQFPETLPVHRLPLDGALSQNSIPSMIQDRAGLMWFATQDRVNVYDGSAFRVLSADPSGPQAPPGVRRGDQQGARGPLRAAPGGSRGQGPV